MHFDISFCNTFRLGKLKSPLKVTLISDIIDDSQITTENIKEILKEYQMEKRHRIMHEHQLNSNRYACSKKKFGVGLPKQKWYINILLYQFDKLEI